MLFSACCCGGCFEVDDCPLAYGGLGDFTYTTSIDIDQLPGTLATHAYTDIQLDFNTDPVQCYASAVTNVGTCCPVGTIPNCTGGPNAQFVEKYWDVMRLETLRVERTAFPCFIPVTTPKALPSIVGRMRCTDAKYIPYLYCASTASPCSTNVGDCGFGVYETDLQSANSYYALRMVPGFAPFCAETFWDVEPSFSFGPLTKSGGGFQIKRNSLTTFSATQISGAGPTAMVYYHRANICPGATQASCGPCTLGGNGGTPCAAGRCCCRSYLQVTLQVKREYQLVSYVWNTVLNDWLPTLGPVQFETQNVTLVYEGPVDERLYRNVGTAAQRTFTLLNGSISGSFNLSANPLGPSVITLDYCNYDVFGIPPGTGGTGGGTGAWNKVVTNVQDECVPCEVNTPPVANQLSMEQLESLGITRTIIVTRQTP